MEPAKSIARLGFRKWYERQLVDSHVSFVTCFLCMLMVAITMEEAKSSEAMMGGLMPFAMMLGFVMLGLAAWRRYQRVLSMAERYAEHATCPQCQCYGRFSVTGSGRFQTDAADESTAGVWLNVSCKRCSHGWRIAG